MPRRARESRNDNGWGNAGYMNVKKRKLQDQFNAGNPQEHCDGSQTNIFEGVSVFVNGYTVPSANDIKRMMKIHGGNYHHYYSRSQTTHMIASNLPDVKVKALTTEKVVRPEWIVDSIKHGQLLPYQQYLLYSAEPKCRTLNFMKNVHLPCKSPSKEPDMISEVNTVSEHVDCTNLLIKTAAQVNEASNTHGSNSSFESRLADPEVVSSEVCKQNSSDISDIKKMDARPTRTLRKRHGNCPVEQRKHDESLNLEESITNVDENHNADHLYNKEGVQFVNSNSSHDASKTAGKLACQLSVRAGDPNFLSEFYSNSRLHHISTIGAAFRNYVKELQLNSDGKFEGLQRLQEWLFKESSNIAVASNLENLQSLNSSYGTNIPLQGRIIMHIDMDCFFVSVGLCLHPELRGKPVGVAHACGPARQSNTSLQIRELEKQYFGCREPSEVNQKDLLSDCQAEYNIDGDILPSSLQNMTSAHASSWGYGSMSEIACCSYEARKFGVHNGMFLGEARKLCPELVTIPYNFEEYHKVARTLYDLVASFTLDLEAVSCDELFADCTEILGTCHCSPMEFATFLRQQVFESTGCTCSIGMAHNMLMARLATKASKPNGQLYLPVNATGDFIGTQKVKDLPGIGRSLGIRLKALNVDTCNDLQNINLSTLQKEFGMKTGILLHNLCRGIDERRICSFKERKSVSAEVNYGIRFTKECEAMEFIAELSKELQTRMRNQSSKGRTITLKLKVRRQDAPIETAKYMGHGICDNVSRSVSLKVAVDDALTIAQECSGLLLRMKIPPTDLRGVGIQISRLQHTETRHASSQNSLTKYLYSDQNQTSNEESHCAKMAEEPTSLEYLAIPGCSTSTISKSPVNTLHKTAANSICENPPLSAGIGDMPIALSQIDPSFLQALPDDIRQELEEVYQKQNKLSVNNKASEEQANHSLHCLQPQDRGIQKSKFQERPKKSPKKNNSPLKQVPYKHLTISQHFAKKVDDIKETLIESCSFDRPSEKSSLCGATQLTEIKGLIFEWVLTCEVPLQDDIQIFSEYLMNLIKDHNLDVLDLIIKHTYRLLSKLQKDDWNMMYNALTDSVQNAIEAKYGSHLKVEKLKVGCKVQKVSCP